MDTTKSPTKQDLIEAISKALRERRQSRRLSLEAISHSLKIRTQFLDALEKGNWDELPGDVYLRGFLMRYAQYLGLDGAHYVSQYMEVSRKSEKKDHPPQKIDGEPGANALWIWGGLVILLAVGVFKFGRPVKEPIKAEPAAPAGHQNVPETPVKNEPVAPIRDKDHVLTVFSPYPLWMRVATEGKSFEGFIPEATSWTWKGEGDFNVRLGHTKEVTMLFDGSAVPLKENQKRVELKSAN